MVLLSNCSPVTLQSLSPSWLTHPLELDSFSSFSVPAPSGMVGVSIADCALPGCWFILSLVHWSYWRGNLTTDAWVFFMVLLHPLCCDTSLVVVMGCLFPFDAGLHSYFSFAKVAQASFVKYQSHGSLFLLKFFSSLPHFLLNGTPKENGVFRKICL